MDITEKLELFEGRGITGKSLGIKYTGARSYARQMAAIERGGTPPKRTYPKIKSTNAKEFDLLNGIRLGLEIRKGNDFFLSVAGFDRVSDKQLAAAKKILMSTPLMKKLVKLAKSMSWQEASKIHTENIKKKNFKDAKYYSLVSSPLHWDFLRKL